MACEMPAGQDYVVKAVNFVATRKTSNLAETFFLQYTGAALHQRHSGLHEPWGVRWSSQVVKSCPLNLQEFSHLQFSIMGSSRFFSNSESLTDKKILWRTCLYPGTSTIGTVRPQSRWIFCYFLRPAPKVQNCLITTCASPVFPYDQVTPKIDVWALGVLLFQIVFKGALPFAEVRPHGSLARLF